MRRGLVLHHLECGSHTASKTSQRPTSIPYDSVAQRGWSHITSCTLGDSEASGDWSHITWRRASDKLDNYIHVIRGSHITLIRASDHLVCTSWVMQKHQGIWSHITLSDKLVSTSQVSEPMWLNKLATSLPRGHPRPKRSR